MLKPITFQPDDVDGLWAWAWSGINDVNLTLGTYNGGDCIDDAVNLASPGTNDFFNDDSGDSRHGRPIYTAPPFDVTAGTYTVPYAPIMMGDGSGTVQYMRQTTKMGASGEFYIIYAVFMSRAAGERWFVGTADSPGNGTIMGSINREVKIVINGTDITLTANGAVPDKAIIEIWRDSSNNLHCWINGVDATNGSPSSTAIFDIFGYGGAGAGDDRGDDYLFELLYYNSLPSLNERLSIRNFVNGHWSLY